MNWLFPGAKVVCIDNQWTNYANEPELVKGNVYVISEVVEHDRNFKSRMYPHSALGVRLQGVKRHTTTPFAVERFRPLLPDTKDTVEELKRKMTDAVTGTDNFLRREPVPALDPLERESAESRGYPRLRAAHRGRSRLLQT